MRAAVDLVSERGTTALSVSDLAEAADVSRQVMYQQFADRDSLLLAAAMDLAERELLPKIADTPDAAATGGRALSVAEHFARYSSFYRPMLTGPCAFGLNQVLRDLLGPFNQELVALMAEDRLTPRMAADLGEFLTGGFGAVFNSWVIEGPDPLDAPAFADRLIQLAAIIATRMAAEGGARLPPRTSRRRG
jgi:AcrR family transcriptional regulator